MCEPADDGVQTEEPRLLSVSFSQNIPARPVMREIDDPRVEEMRLEAVYNQAVVDSERGRRFPPVHADTLIDPFDLPSE